jgi:DNA repair protein RecO (recombination protein O)
MQRIERQPAFVLHERPYRETSALVEVLTRDHGRVGLVAKGLRSARPRFGRGVVVPLQALKIDWQSRGELGLLTGADPVGAPIPLSGPGLLSALYLNELLVRLLPRHDPHPELAARYATCLGELCTADASAQAWALRRFERDLLGSLGVAPSFEHDAGGRAIEPDRRYRIAAEAGAIAVGLDDDRGTTIAGRSLLALGAETQPDRDCLRELKRLFRELVTHQLGGRGLQAWAVAASARSRTADTDAS